MSIKIDAADKAFSWYVRLRDRQCMRCHSPVRYNVLGLPNSHQCSHYFGRMRQMTREDPENADTLCGACHRIWGSDDKEAYRDFKLKQLGEDGFASLILRAHAYKKKDRKQALVDATLLLSGIKDNEFIVY